MIALMKTSPGVGHVSLEEFPEPGLTPKGVKLEVAYAGICGTDIHVYHDRFRNYPPVILGHEFSGTVTEVGGEVRAVKPGDRVTVLGSTAITCGVCAWCRSGNYMFCPVRRGMGHGTHGAFTRTVMVREDQAYRLPDRVSLEEGALAEPFASAVQAIEEITSFHPGDTVLVSGPGPIGLLSLVLLASHRCRVIVAGTGEDGMRLELAARLGADVTVDVSKQDLQAVIGHLTRGRGADAVVEAAGAASSVIACLQAVRPLGEYVQLGILGNDISLPLDLLLYKQVRFYGSLGHSLPSWDRVIRIFEDGKISLAPLITHKLPLSRWREGFQLCEKKQGMKVLLYYDL